MRSKVRASLLLTTLALAVGSCESGPVAPGAAPETPTLSTEVVEDPQQGSPSPAAPGQENAAKGATPFGPDLGPLGHFDVLPVEPELENASIGPEGGTVSLGAFEIVVPPGAVTSNTQFMIRRPVDRTQRASVVAELKPHNVTFAVPVLVRFPLAGTDLEGVAEASIVLWDGTDWVRFPTRVIEGGARLEAAVTHLSFWGSSRWGRAEISSGG